ncbi:gamma-glutamylcyclotransferase [Thermosynechococcus sp. HN-54]|uniref:gamma-glutamylcyclotransferase n=1 Tax=Thermosynechococcus sp. HN-54 TaxID=2933959 RepID=UPI00202CB21F|nr:gamma-glutamylcyclotransferase [Thermosynechococcus sp. HN-54]
MTALAYGAGEDFIDQTLLPAGDYLETILKGAEEHGLPAAYIAEAGEWRQKI